MKKTYLTHALAFGLGVIIAYGINDYVHIENTKGDSQQKLRAKNRAFGNPMDNNKDLMMKSMDNIFKKQMKKLERGLSGGVEVEEFETDKFYKIVISGVGINRDSLKFNVNKGLFVVSLNVEKIIKNDWGTSKTKSSFSRSFYIPKDVDQGNPDVKTEGDNIMIEFKKV